MTDHSPPPGVPPLTRPEMGLAGLGALAAAGVGALGLVSSFAAMSAAAERWDFSEPWMLPVGIDIAIPGFTVANLILIRLDMAVSWVRFVPWILTLITCGLNVAAGDGPAAKIAHGTMPLLWVVFSEIGAHIYAVRIGAATGRRMEKIRFTRWLLAPTSTFALWRRMTLWEVTSYSTALRLEKERQLKRAELRETYGRNWRRSTPRRERVLLRMGELAPATKEETTPPPPVEDRPEAEPKPRPRRTSAKTPAKAKAKQRTFEELLTEARTLTADWAVGELNAEAIRTGVRVSQDNARKLRDAIKSERAEGSSLRPVAAEEVAAA